jgi:hypothetical protein
MHPGQFWAIIFLSVVVFWAAFALIVAPRLYTALTVVLGTY